MTAWIFSGVIGAALISVLIGIYITGRPKKKRILLSGLPYQRRSALLAPDELEFWYVLTKVVGRNYRVFAKLGLEQVVYLPREHRTDEYRKAWGKLPNRHVDFILVHPLTFMPVVAIDLVDISRDTTARQYSDEVKLTLFRQVGLPYLRIEMSSSYDPAALVEALNAKIEPGQPARKAAM